MIITHFTYNLSLSVQMSLCDHRIKIRNRMRKEYIKNIIIKARAEALEFSDKVGHEFTDQ